MSDLYVSQAYRLEHQESACVKGEEEESVHIQDTEETVAPTAFLCTDKKQLKFFEAEKKQHKITQKISDLNDTEERGSLYQKGRQDTDDCGTTDTFSSANSSSDASPSSSISASSSTSSSSSSSSSSSTDSSDSDNKSKRRRKKKKHHHRSHKKKDKRKKKDKKKSQHGKQRARHPEEAIKRYKKVLKAYKKGRKLSVAYRKVGVDRNTIVASAPICELAVVAPKKYKELRIAHMPQQRLQDFAKKCLEVLINDPNLLRDVEKQKKKGKLIPFSKKA
ncbi:coiled-coil domain-containing protein 106-like isoform X4 [Corythoichthys intestinalis]|uniref:coiled-coil domain-containing protein 106-like isoform X4 n=1 Tax=Corythoichthys intestinalis TaxID=161448 RepID=UPI0025A58491|nr:coiled-coil domain-containing protein 106-like isoform X4 [Corythoichthys intestinalis]